MTTMNSTKTPINTGLTTSDMTLATGTDLPELSQIMLSHVLESCLSNNYDRAEMTAAVLGLLTELKPRTALEGLLVAHMISSSLNAMRLTSLALGNNQQQPDATTLNLGIKLNKLFLNQLDCLEKIRGNRGHQKMTIEHIHINEGAQAIIGQVVHEGSKAGGDQ